MTPAPTASVAPTLARTVLAEVCRWEQASGDRLSEAVVWTAVRTWTLAHLAAVDPTDGPPLARWMARGLPDAARVVALLDGVLEGGAVELPDLVVAPESRAWSLGAAHAALRGLRIARSPPDEWTVVLAPTARCPAPQPITRGEWVALDLPGQIQLVVARTGRSVRGVRTALHRDGEHALLRWSSESARVVPGSLFLMPGAPNRELAAHYTPKAVVLDVTRAALAPLLSACTSRSALRALTVCDPAAGTGAFLWGAVVVLAEELVRRPGPHLSRQEALAQVVGCVHGVDIDPWAVVVSRLVLRVLGGRAPGEVEGQVRTGDALVGQGAANDPAETAIEPPDPGLPSAHRAAWLDVVLAVQMLERSSRKRRELLAQTWRDGAGPDGWTLPACLLDRWPRHPSGGPLRPVHWHRAFPQVFSGPSGGFDAVLGNPPYRSARSVDSADRRRYRALLRELHPGFAVGAFDLSTVFWSLVVRTLLGRGGRYGLVVPTASLSSDAPWAHAVQAAAPPDHFFLFPVDAFADARVRTAGVVGGRQGGPVVRVVDRDRDEPVSGVVPASALQPPWYAATRLGDRPPPPRRPTVALSSLVEVRAGCATDAAYRLLPLVTDSLEGPGARLVTTGLLDRYRSLWGHRPVRFLRHRFAAPRWPAHPEDAVVARALRAQQKPKILVGGLTAVLEAWLDAGGTSAGVVSTWCLSPSSSAADFDPFVLLAVLNSATVSRRYMTVHGGAAMSGRQTTIKKRALQRLQVPAVVGAPPLGSADDLALDPWAPAQTDARRIRLLGRLARVLQQPPSPAEALAIDLVLHGLVAALFGLTRSEAEADIRWWRQRSRLPEGPVDWGAAVRTLGDRQVNEAGERGSPRDDLSGGPAGRRP